MSITCLELTNQLQFVAETSILTPRSSKYPRAAILPLTWRWSSKALALGIDQSSNNSGRRRGRGMKRSFGLPVVCPKFSVEKRYSMSLVSHIKSLGDRVLSWKANPILSSGRLLSSNTDSDRNIFASSPVGKWSSNWQESGACRFHRKPSLALWEQVAAIFKVALLYIRPILVNSEDLSFSES